MRGELQLMENVFAVFILLILGSIALVVFALSGITPTDGIQELEAIQIARSVYTFPELQCTILGTPLRNCIDTEKAKAFTPVLAADDSRYGIYFPLIGYSSISLRCEACGLPPGGDSIWSDGIVIVNISRATDRGVQAYQLPLIAYDPLMQRQYPAYLHIEVYR